MLPIKNSDVLLEDALNIAGDGWYTFYVTFAMGMMYFSSLLSIQGMAIAMPAAGCDLGLTNGEKGVLTSMTMTGMLFSAQIFGFLADTFGRMKTMKLCQLLNMLLIVIWSLAPDAITLGAALFLNGFIVTGSLTPAYVAISEFCPAQMKSRILIVMNSLGALANVYLPGLAILVIPLDISIPIFDNLVFTSWRVFVILILIPVIMATLLLWQLPETPKLLLSQGKKEETLEVLKCIFAVLNVILDSAEEEGRKAEEYNQILKYFKLMFTQIGVLFSKQYFLYTLMSCMLLFGEGGMYNTLMLWFPEQTSRVRSYSGTHEVFNVTLCYVMKSVNIPKVVNCELNFDFLFASILIGTCQVLSNLIIGLCFRRIRKRKLIVALSVVCSAATILMTLFLTSEYVIISAFGVVIVVLYLLFPVIVSIIVKLFPTPLRSTATSITLTFARLSAAMGTQILGVLYENHCMKGYFGISLILILTGVLCFFIPRKKKSY